jgi:23S rRNA (uracil1939-C5)-methyltransferase
MRGSVESIAFGGEGILRYQGLVVFLPFTAPGDEVLFEILRQKKNYALGKVLQIITPSALRTAPACPHFGYCGGCQLQHLEYPAQLEIKRKFIKDAFSRIAEAQVKIGPIIPAEKCWAYREHVRLTVRSDEGKLKAGYIGHDHNSFIPISECPIFVDSLNPILSEIQNLLSEWKSTTIPSSLRLFKRQDRFLLIFYFPSLLSSEEIKQIREALHKSPHWEGIILSDPHHRSSSLSAFPDSMLEETNYSIEVEGLKFRFSPLGFIQNHLEQSVLMYRYILEQVQATTQSALDLYCGIGITSLLLAQRGIKTLGVESHSDTVTMAKQNARENSTPLAEFYCGKVEDLLGKLFKKGRFDLVLLNPPRIGLTHRVVSEIIRAKPQRLIYTSCMPATLARDIRFFIKNGYQISSAQGFDMFPQTTHVETVSVLDRIDS